MANEEWKKTRSTGKPIIMMVKSLRQLRYCIDRRGDEVTVTYGYVLKIECDVFIFVSEFPRLVIRLVHDDAGYIRGHFWD